MASAGPGLSHWSLKRVQQVLGLSRRVIAALVAQGFVRPDRGPRNQLRFTFQDMVLLRTAHSLRRGHVPPRRILRALSVLRRDLPAAVPLSGLRISAQGSDVMVRDAQGPRDAASGQFLLDFELQQDGEDQFAVVELPVNPVPDAATQAQEAFGRGEALEAEDRLGAMLAYREAIALDPRCVNAYVNLGAILCEDGACEAAAEVFAAALAHGVADPLLHFNHGIVLEDAGRPHEAADSYRSALGLRPDLADAHHNLGLLLDRLGDPQGALRHLNAYRRLDAGSDAA